MVTAAFSLGCGAVFAQQEERDAGLREEKILPEILAITPSYVFVEVSLLRDELELLRVEMGRSKSDQGEIEVTNAVPCEVHFQARTLFDKANVLSDVYDIATLVVSELVFSHSHLKGAEPVVEEFVSFSERKFPSHVYQRVGMLEERLRGLLMRVKEHPDWLQ